ncbi:NAD(P)-binding protein [Mycena crocata]|nr:NAD(P)-binding protein [Mycena crocata]
MPSTLSKLFPPKPKFSVNDIPDLTGQVIIVTGGNSGVGKETVKALLQHNAKVYVAARSEEKAKAAIVDLKSVTGKQAEFLQLDLADLHSVKRAAAEFNQRETELHVLFNNGGVMDPPIEQLTAQKFDLQFGTNVLGHFYFTRLLLPTLLATAASKGLARVINTSSLSAEMSGLKNGINFNTVTDTPERRKTPTNSLYAQSKLGNIMLSNELARRYGTQGIMSTSLHPGNLKTELGRHHGPIFLLFIRLLVYPVPYGALTQLWAGTTAEGATFNGKYLIPWARMGKTPPEALVPGAAESLWTWMEKQVADI